MVAWTVLFGLVPWTTSPAPTDPFTHRFTAYEGVLRIDPSAQSVAVTVRCSGVTSGEGRSALVVASGLPITAVADADGLALPFAPTGGDGESITVTLPAPLPEDAPFVLEVTSAGTPSCAVQTTTVPRRCGFVGDTFWFDLSLILPRSFAGVDFATHDLEVDAPAGQVLAGSGEVTGGTPMPDGQVAWRLRQPVAAFTRGLVLGPFETGRMPTPNGIVLTFTDRDSPATDHSPDVLVRAVAAWNGYAADYGPATSRSLALVQVDDAGAAMALAGMAWLPRGVWTGEGGGTIHPADLAYVVVPHEVAHQWFPVSASPSPLGGTWLVEGLAEWLAVEAIGREQGDAAARDLLRDLGLRWRLGVPATEDAALGSLVGADRVVDRQRQFLLAYAKSLVALRAIQSAAGADVFRQVLRALVADLGPGGGFFDATMLRQRLAAASGLDLDALFAAWVAGRGSPVVRVEVSPVAAPPGRSGVRVAVAVGGAIAGVGMESSVPRLAMDVRTDAGTTRVALTPVGGTAVTWLELDGRFLGLAPDPDVLAPGARFLPALTADVDHSGDVDGLDLLAVAAAQGAAFATDARYREACDFDASGVVDAADLARVLAAFGMAAEGITR